MLEYLLARDVSCSRELKRRGHVGARALFKLRSGWQPAGRPPVTWRATDKPFEDRGEMGLGLEADRQRDLHDRHGAVSQKLFGAPHSPSHKEFVRAQTRRRAEL